MKILLAIDDSKYGQEALRTLMAQAKTRGTEVRVLHVIEELRAYISAEMMPHLVHYAVAMEDERRKQARALVHRAAQQLHKAGFHASEVVDKGDPKIQIIDHAAKWRADLIVLGSHGWKGLNRFLMGSVSDAVTRHAGCSVQVVRARTAAPHASRRKSRR